MATQYKLDLGFSPNQIPTNSLLGGMAFQRPDAVTVTGGSVTGIVGLGSLGGLLLGGAVPGSSGTKLFAMTGAAPPTTAPTDTVQLWDADIAAGQRAWHLLNETGSAGVVASVVLKATTGDPASGYEGQCCINSADHTYRIYREGAWRSFVGLSLYNMSAITNHTGIVTGQSIATDTGAIGSRTIPAGWWNFVGKSLTMRMAGFYSTDASAGTGVLSIKAGNTVLATTGTMALDNSTTNGYWHILTQITCRTTGASGTVQGQSLFLHLQNDASESVHGVPLLMTSGVSIDLTAAQTIDVVWTASDAGTTFKCTDFSMKLEF